MTAEASQILLSRFHQNEPLVSLHEAFAHRYKHYVYIHVYHFSTHADKIATAYYKCQELVTNTVQPAKQSEICSVLCSVTDYYHSSV